MEKILYPSTQRRLRTDQHIRELTATVKLSHKSFIQPVFIEEGLAQPRDIAGLSHVQVHTTESVQDYIEFLLSEDITKIILFPIPANKTTHHFDFGFAAAIIKKIKVSFGNSIWLAADLCLCSYTIHGHCGILTDDHSELINNKTVQVLCNYAVTLSQAGADCIAPSDMMDGRIGAIRQTLDAFQFDSVSIMSYAAKFSSQFYGPFRDACHSAPNSKKLKNRKTYQVSPANGNDAVASALRDAQEGADILMIKPAALYTDIIVRIHQSTTKPIAAYHVSGEYAAIESLVRNGLADRASVHLEVWTALQRSGANIIISYAACNAKKWIEQNEY